LNELEDFKLSHRNMSVDVNERTAPRDNISLNAFTNYSGVRLDQFLEQMSFLESRANHVFLKALGNL